MKKTIAALEKTLTKVSDGLPHLPKKVVDWLYENIWWIVAAVVGLSVLGALSSRWLGLFVRDMYGLAGFGFVVGDFFVVLGMLGLTILAVAATVVAALAIMPLKEKQKRGWDLLFLGSLIGAVASIVSALFSGWFFLSNIVSAAVGLAISWYLLFELRGHYVAKKPSSANNK